MPAAGYENISCGSPHYLLNPVPPNEKPSYPNRFRALVVSWDASSLAVYTVTKFLRRTIPLCGTPKGSAGLVSRFWKCFCIRGTSMTLGFPHSLCVKRRTRINAVAAFLPTFFCKEFLARLPVRRDDAGAGQSVLTSQSLQFSERRWILSSSCIRTRWTRT